MSFNPLTVPCPRCNARVGQVCIAQETVERSHMDRREAAAALVPPWDTLTALRSARAIVADEARWNTDRFSWIDAVPTGEVNTSQSGVLFVALCDIAHAMYPHRIDTPDNFGISIHQLARNPETTQAEMLAVFDKTIHLLESIPAQPMSKPIPLAGHEVRYILDVVWQGHAVPNYLPPGLQVLADKLVALHAAGEEVHEVAFTSAEWRFLAEMLAPMEINLPGEAAYRARLCEKFS